MKKYNLSVIMKRAWAIKKQNNKNIFAECLKMAWEEAKEINLYTTADISLEVIGTMNKPWIAIIRGKDDKYGYNREFLNGTRDYSNANSKKTRGVMVNYTLESGYTYEICSPESWNRTDRYFAKVVNGEIVRLDSSEIAA